MSPRTDRVTTHYVKITYTSPLHHTLWISDVFVGEHRDGMEAMGTRGAKCLVSHLRMSMLEREHFKIVIYIYVINILKVRTYIRY